MTDTTRLRRQTDTTRSNTGTRRDCAEEETARQQHSKHSEEHSNLRQSRDKQKTIDTLFQQTETAARNLEQLKEMSSQIKMLESEFSDSKESAQAERSRLMKRISEVEKCGGTETSV